jgi:hypothetical protein
MSRTAAVTKPEPLTEEEQLINGLGTAIVNRDTDQLKAAVNELGKRYTEEELASFWKDINSDLTEEDVSWLKINLIGQDVQPEPVKPLTEREAKRLQQLETTINKSIANFEKLSLQVGEALKEIDEKQLWRGSYNSFKDYCLAQERWSNHSFGYRRARQLVSAVAVLDTVKETLEVNNCSPATVNEGILRELGREKDVAKRNQILQEAITTVPDITATVVRETRERISPTESKPPKALPQGDLTFQPGDLVTIDNPASPHSGKWGWLDTISPDRKRIKVKIGSTIIVFDSDEVQLEQVVLPAIASRIESLCQSAHPHVRELATTFCSHHEFEQWQQDLLDYLDKVS